MVGLQEIEFRRKLISTVKCYPCLYDPHNQGYNVDALHRDVWDQIAKSCGKKASICRRAFERMLLNYGQFFVLDECSSQGLPPATAFSNMRLREMQFFRDYIPIEKVKQRLLKKSEYTNAQKMVIARYEYNSGSPDRGVMPPPSDYQPAFQTNIVHTSRSNRAIQSRQSRQRNVGVLVPLVPKPRPQQPQNSGVDSQPNPQIWHNSERKRNCDPDWADIELFFGDISQATIKSGASSDDFQEIQNIILNILAEKLPQYNSN